MNKLSWVGQWRELWRHRVLLRDMAVREVRGRYRASFLGMGWTLAKPLLLLLVFSYVFGEVFKVRWPQAGNVPGSFALTLMCGIAVFELLFDSAGRAHDLITGNANYVKRVVFPLAILPLTLLGAALFHVAVLMGLVLLASAWVFGASWAWLLLPLVWGAYALGLAGVCWVVAALGAYLRDIGQILPVALTALQFLSPVFYPVTAVPEIVRPWVEWVPMTWVIESTRGIVLRGDAPAASELLVAWGIGAALAVLGLAAFHKLRAGFADVL
jgi:lipopolysaccharide transport system permease protein